jgi:hypothetical protein
MTLHLTPVAAKDGAGTAIPGGIQQHDTSGTGAGPNDPAIVLIDSTGAEILGTKVDAKSTATDATSVSLMQVWKQVSASVQAMVTALVPVSQNVMASSLPVAIASDQSPVKTLTSITASQNGLTRSRVNAAATTNATSLKATAGQSYHLKLFNSAAYAVFFKLYNKASAPTVGTDVPIVTIEVPAGGLYSETVPFGLPFSTGIAYAITKLQADTDTTVLVAGDLTGEMVWI